MSSQTMKISFKIRGKNLTARSIVNKYRKLLSVMIRSARKIKFDAGVLSRDLLVQNKTYIHAEIRYLDRRTNTLKMQMLRATKKLEICIKKINIMREYTQQSSDIQNISLEDEYIDIRGEKVYKMLRISEEALIEIKTMIKSEMILLNFITIHIYQMMKFMGMEIK